MSAAQTPLKVVIAADTAMSRDVVRFFLQGSEDIEVIGQAASAGDASWMAKKYSADAIVIHAGIAFDATQDAVRRVRKAAPAARIVVVTPEGGGVPLPMTSRGADSYLEEGVGLAELAFVLVSLCRSPDIAIDVQPAFDRRPQPDPIVVLPQPESELVFAGTTPSAAVPATTGAGLAAVADADPPGVATSMPWRGRGGIVPLLAAAAAFVMVVGLTLYRTQVEDLFAPRGTAYFAGVHIGPHSSVLLRASEERLGDLVQSLDGARIMNAPAIARDLVERRSQILDAGGDVGALDREIETTLRPILAASPPGIAVAVLTVLAPVANWASADLDALLLGGPSPTPGGHAGQAPAPSGPSGAGPTGADGALPSPSDPGPTGGAVAGVGTGGSGESEGSTHDGAHDGSGDGSGHEGGGSGDGPGGDDGSGDGDGGGGDGSGQDGDGEGGGGQGGDGDQGGGGAGGEDDQGEDDQGSGGDGSGDQGDEGCHHPGQGGGHGYGHCEGQGGGNDDRADGEDPNSGGGNHRAADLMTGSVLLLGLRRPRR